MVLDLLDFPWVALIPGLAIIFEEASPAEASRGAIWKVRGVSEEALKGAPGRPRRPWRGPRDVLETSLEGVGATWERSADRKASWNDFRSHFGGHGASTGCQVGGKSEQNGDRNRIQTWRRF